MIVDKVFNHFKTKNKKVKRQDIALYIRCQGIEDYTEMHKTDLYVNQGCLYCEMLEVIHRAKRGNKLC